VFDERMRTETADRQAIEHDLRRAVASDELVVQYQPIIDLATGGLFGAEALVRWRHPERGLLFPADFVPVAEETGLIVPLGHWVLAEACRRAAEWQAETSGRRHVSLSVNVSTHQFRQPEWADEVAFTLARSALPPGRLVIEITESAVMENTDVAAVRLEELRRLGVRLAIDDFGTGYSSLGYLKHLPVDILKVDKSFIETITEGPHESALARAVLRLARTLRLQSVAEGVERQEQLVLLQRLGCQLGQGFYLGRPQQADEFVELMLSSPAIP
jgi:EAL domain-containing protein (putative c-di-GMP-specific phosphodiesterase class I)